MKVKLKIINMNKWKSIIVAVLIFNIADAQKRDGNNNLYSGESEVLKAVPTTNSSPITIPLCTNQNSFWGLEQVSGALFAREFDLTNNVVTYTGNSIPWCSSCYSLAISNNLDSGAFTPTFYTSSGSTAYYWDGNTSFISCGPSSLGYCLCNAAGNGDYLYFQTPDSPSPIMKYDGTSYTTIFESNKQSGIADIAVDNSGNVYSVSSNNNIADSLYIISPGGLLINKYPISYNHINAYGCFMLNNVLYIGFGPTSATFPNKLVPVTISGNNAVLGTPIPMPAGFNISYDLASCNPGTLLGINSGGNSDEGFTLFPNPVSSKFIITFKNRIVNGNVEILNTLGEKIQVLSIYNESKLEIDVEDYSAGVYFVKVFDNERNYTKKIIIE